MDQAFVARIADVIDRLGGTNAAARKADIPKSTLSQYKTGAAEPTRPQLVKLAAAGEVDLGWLAAGAAPNDQAAEHQIAFCRSSYAASEVKGGSFDPEPVETIGVSQRLLPLTEPPFVSLPTSELLSFEIMLPDSFLGVSRPAIVIVERITSLKTDRPLVLLLGTEIVFRFALLAHNGIRLYAGRDMAQYTEELSFDEFDKVPFKAGIVWAAGPM